MFSLLSCSISGVIPFFHSFVVLILSKLKKICLNLSIFRVFFEIVFCTGFVNPLTACVSSGVYDNTMDYHLSYPSFEN